MDIGESLWDLMERRALATPDAVVAIDDRRTIATFGQLHAWSIRIALDLRARGVRAGDVVSWQIPTWVDALALTCALDLLGAVQNPLMPTLRRREVGFITTEARTRWLVHCGVWRGFDHGDLARTIAAAADHEIGVFELTRDARRRDAAAPSTFPGADDVDRSGTRWLFYTSGTTGDPKGVRHEHRSVAAATASMCTRMRIGPDDRSIVAFPLTHVGGINWLMAALMTGCSLLVVETFSSPGTMDLIAESGVSLAGVTTAFHLAYLDEQRRRPDRRLLPVVRAYPGGAAPKPPALHYDLVREVGGVGIVSGFGLTESPMIAMSSVEDEPDRLAHTEGRPSDGMEVRVTAADGTVCPAGVDGELRIRGSHLMAGYVDARLDATAFDSDGFFRTGDLGHLDDAGYVVITGRLKDVIVRKGENISAQEIENLLFEHASVADVAVVGRPDTERGEMVCAVVVAAPGTSPTLGELVDHLRSRELMAQKLPEMLLLVDVLPRNGSGKVVKDDLRARVSVEAVTGDAITRHAVIGEAGRAPAPR